MTTDESTTQDKSQRWREFVEEKNSEGHPVLTAVYIRGTWIGLVDDGTHVMRSEKFLILKPRPRTCRPWKPEEVPVGRVVVEPVMKTRHLITSTDEFNRASIGLNRLISLAGLFDQFKLVNTDGSLSVCGVEEP